MYSVELSIGPCLYYICAVSRYGKMDDHFCYVAAFVSFFLLFLLFIYSLSLVVNTEGYRGSLR